MSEIDPLMPERQPLNCRAGDYTRFLETMLSTARAWRVPDGDLAGNLPLARLSLQESGNFVVALFRAWAKIADILAFYQERYINEGYLLTATEAQSITELARTVGYEISPGVAANVQLSFTVSESPGVPHELEVPAGTRVQSIPPAGKDPQVFETLTTETVRGEWSAVPARPPLRYLNVIKTIPDPSGKLFEIHAAGTATGIDPGDCVILWTPSLSKAALAGPLVVPDELAPALTQVVPIVAPVALTRLVWSWDGYKTPADLTSLNDGADAKKPVGILAFQQPARAFGYAAPAWNSLPPAVQVLNGGTVGAGVLRSTVDYKTWTPANAGLPVVATGTLPAQVVLAASDGSLYAGGAAGVYRLAPAGDSFESVNTPFFTTNVTCLAEGPAGVILAGASGALYRSADAGKSWSRLDGTVGVEQQDKKWITVTTNLPAAPVRAIVVDSSGVIYAGTEQGLFSNDLSGTGWKPLGITGVVHALAYSNGTVYAGADTGCYSVSANGVTPKTSGLPSSTAIVSIQSYKGDLLCAGLNAVYRFSAIGGVAWQQQGPDLPAPVTSLAITPDGTVLAAIASGLYRFTPQPPAWARVGPVLFSVPSNSAVTASLDQAALSSELAAIFAAHNMTLPSGAKVQVSAGGTAWVVVPGQGGPNYSIFLENGNLNVYVLPAVIPVVLQDGSICAITPSAGVMETEWPGMSIAPDYVDLDDLYPKVVPGSMILLRQPNADGTFRTAIFSAQAVSQVRRDDFWLTATVTRVTITPGMPTAGVAQPSPSDFSVRAAAVSVVGQLCAQAQEPACNTGPDGLHNLTLLLGRKWTRQPDAGRAVIVTGKPVFNPPDDAEKDSHSGTVQPFVSRTKVLSRPPGDSMRVQFHLDDRQPLSTAGHVIAVNDADDKQPGLLKTVRVASPEAGFRVSLPPQAGPALDPSTMRLHANIVQATQGETVPMEMLGSGDASLAHQRFTLKKFPLIAIQPTGQGPALSTLTVFVNKVAWKETPSFDGMGPADQVYVVRLDVQRQATIVFGDGVEGARLPTGSDNVTATYRVGDPAQGAVVPGSLSNIRGRPLGVHAVTNYAAASVPKMPETPQEVLRRAPLSTATLDRLIALSDYEAFAERFDSVSQATARSVFSKPNRRTASLPAVEVTVLFADSGSSLPSAPSIARCEALRDLIRAAQAVPVNVSVVEAEVSMFVVEAPLYYSPGADVKSVSEAVGDALAAAFSLESRRIGQNVAAAEVLSVIQSVPGVAGARLKSIQRLLKDGSPVGAPSAGDLIAGAAELLIFAGGPA